MTVRQQATHTKFLKPYLIQSDPTSLFRRLSEILAFPKAWYNRSIARRLFLGEQGAASQKQEPKSTQNETTEQWRTAVRVSTVLRELRIEMNIGNVLGKTTWINQLRDFSFFYRVNFISITFNRED